MSTWLYCPPAHWTDQSPRKNIAPRAFPNIETLGATQLTVLLRARNSNTGTLVLTHERARNAERMAARRLVARGLLSGPNYLGPQGDGLYAYALTERGRRCWLRVKQVGV